MQLKLHVVLATGFNCPEARVHMPTAPDSLGAFICHLGGAHICPSVVGLGIVLQGFYVGPDAMHQPP